MNRHTFFKLACNANAPLSLWWVTTAFAVLKQDTLAQETPNYALQKVNGKYQYYLNEQWNDFTDAPKEGALFSIGEPITVKKGEILNIKEDTQTTVTRLLANCILSTSIFGDRLAYINKQHTVADVSKLIADKVVDDHEHVDNTTFSMSEYLKLGNRTNYITSLSGIFFSSAGPEMMESPVWLKSYKAQLLEQYKDTLDKPETAAKIDEALLDRYIKEELSKGTSGRFLINKKKQLLNVRKTLLSYGAEFNITGDTDKVKYIPNSLDEGVDPKTLPDLYNAQRAGSYGRGKETQEGGVSVKEALAAAQNFTMELKDCGSKKGVDITVTEKIQEDLVGKYLNTSKGPVNITKQDVGKYLGKSINVRSPLYCSSNHTSWCKICLGDKITINPDALTVAIMNVSSVLLLTKMAKQHSTGMNLVTLDLDEVIM